MSRPYVAPLIILSSLFALCFPAFAGTYELISKSGGTDGVAPYGYGISTSAAKSLSVSPTFTLVFKWKPTPGEANDIPPRKVTVIKSSYVSTRVYLPNQPASASNGLGDAAINTSDPSQTGRLSDGTKRTTQNGDDQITVTFTPSASGSNTGYGVSAVLSVTATIGLNAPVILRDGNVITDANNKCLPGEGIGLSVRGADAVSPYSWSITGEIFKNFTPSTPSVYEGAGAVVKTQPTIAYRYVKGESDGSPKKVNVTVKVNGESIDVEDELKVYQPDSQFLSMQGGARSNSTNMTLEPPKDKPNNRGIEWVGTFVKLPIYGSGEFGFFQTGTVSRSGKDANGKTYRLPPSASTGLDYGGPYGGFTAPVGTTLGLGGAGAGDSPSDGFGLLITQGGSPTFIALSELSVSDSFKTWLMFRKSPNDCWVPLRSITWSWGATTTSTAYIDQRPASGNTTNGSTEESFPSWTADINPRARWIETTTP